MPQEQTPALKPCPLAEAAAQQIADSGPWGKRTDNYARIYQAAVAGYNRALTDRAPDPAVAGLVEALDGYLSDCTNEECEYCIRARQALKTWSVQ